MKQLLFIILVVCSFGAKADTISNWQVYHNKTRIYAFHEFQPDRQVVLKLSELKNTDTITVHFHQCSPSDEVFYLSLENGKHQRLYTLTEKGSSTPFKIPVSHILKFVEGNRQRYFEVHHGEALPGKRNAEMLFTVLFE